jgi:hypothetical protein
LIALWIMATPAFSNWISAPLESQFPPVQLEALPHSDAVIVLGGFLRQPTAPRLTFDLTDAADRALQALRIYRAGKATRILISGGNLPWQAGIVAEAELVADLLLELGTPRSALTLDGAHTWDTDGFAFFLVEKVLKPGGWILFDDLRWTYSSSPALKDRPSVRDMNPEARDHPQMSAVWEQLVLPHTSFGNFSADENWGWAQKIRT